MRVGKRARVRLEARPRHFPKDNISTLKFARKSREKRRDFESSNVEIINRKAEQLNLSDRAHAIQADAFSATSYNTEQNYQLAIASGLFELFSDNALITAALTGIHQQLDADGYMLYTNQLWHPQQEFIARTLTNHRGQPWLMRCRSQAEMDTLVKQAGFEKVEMLIDPSGLFSVSVAKKR